MKKKSSPQKSRQTNGPTETDLARVRRLFSLLPDEVVKEAFQSTNKSISIFLKGIGRGLVAQQQAFAQYGIDYTQDIAPRLWEVGLYFLTLRDFGKGVEAYVKPIQKSFAPYVRAASLLTKPEAPFPPPLKDAIRQEAEHLAALSQLKVFSRYELERYFQIPEGTKSLDPDTQKSLHKHPMFVRLGDDLFSHLQRERVSKYRAARLLYNLWLSVGIIRTSEDCDLPSFERHLRRLQKRPSHTPAAGIEDKLAK